MYLGDAKTSLEKLLSLLERSDTTSTTSNIMDIRADIESMKKDTEKSNDDKFSSQISELQSNDLDSFHF